MLDGKYRPILLKTLPVEKGVGLFDFLASHFENPYSNQIINLRPISYHSEPTKTSLVKIFDKRIFDGYWNCNPGDGKDIHYLDVDLNYHFFKPTHIYYRHHNGRQPKAIEVKCGMSSEDMETILKIDKNTLAENTVKVENDKMCRFFRYQMNGKNAENLYNIDLYNFDLYGNLYASVGLSRCTSVIKIKTKIIVALNISLNN